MVACANSGWSWGNTRERRAGRSRDQHPPRVEVLLALGSEQAIDHGGLGVTRIAESLGREKSQISRTLKILAEHGLVDRDPDTLPTGWAGASSRWPTWPVSAGCWTRAARCSSGWWRRLGARPPLGAAGRRHAHDRIGVVAALAAGGRLGGPHQPRLLHVGRPGAAARPQPRRAGAAVRRHPLRAAWAEHAHATCASSPRIERRASCGYAVADEEMEPGLMAVAAPVRDAHGRIVAAVNVRARSFG